ncbi:MAG: SDR family NAD(P)-dependent oxidoreductase, partial [Pseudomonadota bacterium]
MGSDRLSGKIAIISGGASGIGAASAKRFVDEGAHVIIGDLNAAKAEALAEELGASAIATELDVREPNHWKTAFQCAAKLGDVTTLVNSAGVSIPGSIEDIDLDQFRTTLSINLDGVFLGCKFAVEAMKAGSGGSIINVGSTLGIRYGAIFPAYSST